MISDSCFVTDYCRLHVISNNSRLNETAQAMVSQLQEVEAQLHLFLQSLDFDASEAKKIDFCKLYSFFYTNSLHSEYC
jgi:hypothetical protein